MVRLVTSRSFAAPRRRLPHSDTFTGVCDDIFMTVREKLELQLKDIEYISITSDAATSTAGDELVAVTGHFVALDWSKISSVVLAVSKVDQSKTAEFLADHLEGMVKDWGGKKKVVSCTTGTCAVHCRDAAVTGAVAWLAPCADNGANFLAAVRLGQALDVIDEGVRCACHTINLWYVATRCG